MNTSNDNQFLKHIESYQAGTPIPLREWVNNVEVVSGFEWQYLSNLLREQRMLNINVGDFYIGGTLDIFTTALSKLAKEEERLYCYQRLCSELLFEDSKLFNDFLKIYVEKSDKKLELTSSLIGLLTTNNDMFWETFHHRVLDDICGDETINTVVQIRNLVVNINSIMDADISQHKKIQKAIEWDSEFPYGQAFSQALKYSYDFDKYILARSNLNRLGRDEDKLQIIKKIMSALHASELQQELVSQDNLKHKKPKI